MIQSDRVEMKKTTPGFSLHKGNGDRNFSQNIQFDNPFASLPNVYVGICGFDVDNSYDFRIHASANNVKNNSFDLVVGTWNDSHIFQCMVMWFAFDKTFSDNPGGASGWRFFTGRHPFKKDQPAYTLLKGEGNRSVKTRVNFPKKFQSSPSVIVTLSQLDTLKTHDNRVQCASEGVTNSAFDLKIATWSDTEIWSVSGNWLANGDPERGENENKNNNNDVPAKKQKVEQKGEQKGEQKEEKNEEEKKKAPEKVEEKECKICMDAEINVVLVPCGHLCVCQNCSKVLNGRCPICKTAIQKVVKTFTT